MPSRHAATDSIVVLDSPREQDEEETTLHFGPNKSYDLFLSSGERSKGVELNFLNTWARPDGSASIMGGTVSHNSYHHTTTSTSTNTRCVARGSLVLPKTPPRSSPANLHSGTSDYHHHHNNIHTTVLDRSFVTKLIIGVGGRVLSKPLGQGTYVSPEKKVLLAGHEQQLNNGLFLRAKSKSLMSGEFNDADATSTVKIGTAFSGEETDELLENSNNQSKKNKSTTGRSLAMSQKSHNNNNNAIIVRPHLKKKKTLKSRVARVANLKSLGSFDFPASLVTKRLGIKGKRIAAAAPNTDSAANNNSITTAKVYRTPSVKHLGIFNFDDPSAMTPSYALPPKNEARSITSTITDSDNNNQESQPSRCNVVVRTVRSESSVEIKFWTDLISQRTRGYGKHHALTRAATIELATAYTKNGDAEKAVQTLREALDSLEERDREQSLVAAVILEKLASALSAPKSGTNYFKKNNHQDVILEALGCFNQALRIRYQFLGPLHIDTVECLNTMAALYFRCEDFHNAETAYYEVLVLRRAIFGKDISGLDHPSVAVAAQKLGQVHARLAEPKKALEYYKMAEHIYASLQVPAANPSFKSLQRDLKATVQN
ncbi:nephronophthisis 3 (adolescent) [Seminavis robusta]|uniref:Nephronophthisis 3 (Adolescent) n=1 Tax=Seminavis robusta TaxID=568900 RepID=A0A9N8HT12_9STRA|nr:nephronophthisis 3 (adolescent) [Seminavis robusta]|eukprot:Sro1223_g253870.1 nephronophthisis 3 (adolescent) (601) ;mRNA; r:7572-9374